MNEQSVFHFISDVTAREGVSCILIGGFAVNYYKVTRQTADVDFLITKKEFEKIFHYFRNAGYKKEFEQDNFTQLRSTRVSLMDVDFIFVDENTLTGILQESRKINIAGQEFFVPSLDHLIALKLHSIKNNPKNRSSRDLPDIIDLLKINEIDANSTKFKALCLKYGTEDVYRKILEGFN